MTVFVVDINNRYLKFLEDTSPKLPFHNPLLRPAIFSIANQNFSDTAFVFV